MKQIIAIVKPFLAEKVIQAVADCAECEIEEISIREVKGYGRQKNYLREYGENEYSMAFVPKVEISIWVANDQADEIVNQVVEVSRTGRMGDGKIMIMGGTYRSEVF